MSDGIITDRDLVELRRKLEPHWQYVEMPVGTDVQLPLPGIPQTAGAVVMAIPTNEYNAIIDQLGAFIQRNSWITHGLGGERRRILRQGTYETFILYWGTMLAAVFANYGTVDDFIAEFRAHLIYNELAIPPKGMVMRTKSDDKRERREFEAPAQQEKALSA